MLSKGVPFVIGELGEPLHVERGSGAWDLDIYTIPRTLYFPGVTIKTYDYIHADFDVDLKNEPVVIGTTIDDMLVDGGNFQFALGLTLGSNRVDVEKTLGLPCSAVAYSGRPTARKLASYGLGTSDPNDRSNYSVTISFDRADNIESVRWSITVTH